MAVLLAPEGAAAATPLASASALRSAVVPGEAIVRFERGAGPSDRLAARSAAGVAFQRSLRVPRTQLVEVEGGVAAAVRRLERQPGVVSAQPNYRYRALAVEPPNDPRFAQLWGLKASPGVGVLDAWEHSRGAGQVIAVLDTGVALDQPHPDLAPNLWTGPGGVHGHDFVDDDTVPDDFHYHGTHVAGTAAAAAGNGIGVAGVAPEAEIMAVRVLDGNGSGTTATIADGIEWAAANGADVINLSLGGPAEGGDPALEAAIALADAHDVLVVAAAGNDANDNDVHPQVPCALPEPHPNLICVAAVTSTGALASYSNYGPTTVDVGAPGSGIVSADVDFATVPGGSDDFSNAGNWSTGAFNGGIAWSQVPTPNSDGNPAASDSEPGSYGRAVSDGFAESWLIRAVALSLAGRRGCLLAFDTRYEIESGEDFLLASAVADAPAPVALDTYAVMTGSTRGSFLPQRASIAHLDGHASVFPAFVLLSNDSVEMDGAYVDALRVRCRTDPPLAGSYATLSGTSMATPHVAGVAALVRAAAPDATAAEVRAAIEQGGVPLDALACGKTATGRAVDAAGAIAAVLGELPAGPGGASPVSEDCDPDGGDPKSPGGPGTPGDPPPLGPSPDPSPLAPPAAPRNPAPSLRVAARRSARVSHRGRFAYVFRTAPGARGRAVLRTRGRVRVGPSRRVRLTVARGTFRAGPGGRVRLRLKLSRRALRVLRREGRLELRVTVTARTGSGRRARASGRLTLRAPRR